MNKQLELEVKKCKETGVTSDMFTCMVNKIREKTNEVEKITDKKNKLSEKNYELSRMNLNLENEHQTILVKNNQLDGQNKKLNKYLAILLSKNYIFSLKYQHAKEKIQKPEEKISHPVYVADSTILSAESGLFAEADIEEGSIFGEYTGRRVFRLKIPSTGKFVVWGTRFDGTPEYLKSDSYTIWGAEYGDQYKVEKGIDANYPEAEKDRCKFRFINHSFNHNAVVRITGKDDRMWLQAFRSIKEGQEVFWDYYDGNETVFDQGELPPQDHIHKDSEKYVEFDSLKKKVRIRDEHKVINGVINKTVWR